MIFGTIHGFPSTLELANLNGSNGFEIQGIESYQHIGQSVSSAGDINHDGIDDLIIGSSTHRANDIFLSGSAYILFGSSNGFASSINLAELDGLHELTDKKVAYAKMEKGLNAKIVRQKRTIAEATGAQIAVEREHML